MFYIQSKLAKFDHDSCITDFFDESKKFNVCETHYIIMNVEIIY